jgi:hypothetical protein
LGTLTGNIDSISIVWPSSHTQEFTNVVPNQLVTITEGFLADFDLDGDVDGADFLKLQQGELSNPHTHPGFEDWQEYFGTVANSIAAASVVVPEPATEFMLMLGMAVLITGSRTATPIPSCSFFWIRVKCYSNSFR